MAKKPTKPLKVTAKLYDGRINSADGIIMFDSIVYHGWFAKYHPEVLEGLSDNYYEGYVGLPLRQLPNNRWAASKGIYEEIAQTVEYWNKRPNFFNPDKIYYLNLEKGIIYDGIGFFRAYRVPNIIRIVADAKIEFFCVGHAGEVEELLTYVPAIGKKSAMGWGHVKKWEIEETREDYSLWHPDHGLMRPTPINEAPSLVKHILDDPTNNLTIARDKKGEINIKGCKIMDYGIRPPYWKPCNFKRCYV